MTEGFLTYSKAQGNDLSTPVPTFGFPGLKPVITGAFVHRVGSRPMTMGWLPPSGSSPQRPAPSRSFLLRC